MGVRVSDVEAICQAHRDFNQEGTFSHHAVGAAGALATMEYLEENNLIALAALVGEHLGARLRHSLADLPSVGDVRGIGMLWSIGFVADRETKAPFPPEAQFADRVFMCCMEKGVLLYPGHGSVDGVRGDHLTVAPPYVVTEDQIEVIVSVLDESIRQIGQLA
jgi:adenosylmethionine-8-amino-7-oxononanoate aminotransferase